MLIDNYILLEKPRLKPCQSGCSPHWGMLLGVEFPVHPYSIAEKKMLQNIYPFQLFFVFLHRQTR